MRKPLHVAQDEAEDDLGWERHYWYSVRAGNGEPVLTSKMYKKRSQAKRAALAFIASIDPVPVHFSWWSGKPDGKGSYTYHSERIR